MTSIALAVFRFIYTFEFVGIFCIMFFFFPIYSSSHNVPALYIFGDSTVDAGNNNHLPYASIAQPAFGIDSNNGSPIGRFTNGKTIADFLATKMGLPLIPAYYDLSEDQRKRTMMGINYGSGGCGLLINYKEPIMLNQQIGLFAETVCNDLIDAFQNCEELDLHLANSLFLISIGTNDYILNGNKVILGGQHLANNLLEQLALQLKRLIDLGAKKFLVNNIGPLGCIPSVTNNTGICKDEFNTFVKMYDDGLPKMLHMLQEDHKGTVFSYSDNFKFFQQVKSQGILNTKMSCVNKSGVCNNRDTYFFFDGIHTTQAANSEFVDGCFYKSLCTPNVEELISK